MELKSNKRIISIAGSVGVGKSTLAKKLADSLGYEISLEKVEGNPFLEPFYGNFKEWSFQLQLFNLVQRYHEQMKMAESSKGCVQDRSIYEDYYIFSQMLYEQRNMEERDFKRYVQLFESVVSASFFPKPDVLIYITGDFNRIIERIIERGREMEQSTPESYWKDLHQRYEKWINEFTVCPVITLNIDEYDLINDPDSINEILNKINKI